VSDKVENPKPENAKPENGKAENEKTGKNAPKFDWVTERSSCSLPKIFSALRSQVEVDVNSRNALRPDNSPYEFSIAENAGDFTVTLQAKEVRQSVRDDKSNPMFDVSLTFTDEGKCRLNVNNQPRELWQVRRMALEELFFRGY
jgi:hypothetical protein